MLVPMNGRAPISAASKARLLGRGTPGHATIRVLVFLFGLGASAFAPATGTPAAPPVPRVDRASKEIRLERDAAVLPTAPPIAERFRAQKTVFDENPKASHKGAVGKLCRATLLVRKDLRGQALAWEPIQHRQLSRGFPNTRFHRLSARSPADDIETIGAGAICMGQALVLPHDVNLLCALEGRPLNALNLRFLCELIVRMVDPDGARAQTFARYRVKGDRAPLPETVVLETLSVDRRMRTRWTFAFRDGRFHSLEEIPISYRTPLLENRPEEIVREEISSSGEPTYVAFWRSAHQLNEASRVRAAWLAEHAAVPLPEIPSE